MILNSVINIFEPFETPDVYIVTFAGAGFICPVILNHALEITYAVGTS